MWRVIGRYLLGTALVGALAVGGVVIAVAVPPSGTPDRADAIVVLGAAQYDGTPSPVFAARLDLAHDLYTRGIAPALVTVGSKQEGDRFTEAEAGGDYLEERGVPATAITEIGQGGDTLQSLRAAADDLHARGLQSVVLVTDPEHAHRSALMARDLGLDPQVAVVVRDPADDIAPSERYVLREAAATLFHLVVGGSSGLGQEVW